MAKNKESLTKAKKEKNDEFYTQYEDIERELAHYMDHFKDKVVFCNCDDPEWSNFWKYFESDFSILGLKKLIATHYEENNPSYKLELECIDGKMVKTETPLKGNGDFRNQECIDILKECDIVVTNPPFSLFREYIGQLIEYNKSFLIIGNMNSITYKEIFPLIKDKKVWLGYGFKNGNSYFRLGKDHPDFAKGVHDKETGLVKFRNIVWFTNLEHKKRHQKMILFRTYEGNESEYPKYDNYDAINIDESKNIPKDYYGNMGVPITFLDKFCPDQFQIIGLGKQPFLDDLPNVKKYKDSYQVDKSGNSKKTTATNTALMILEKNKPNSKTYYTDKEVDGYLIAPYARLIIKRIDLDDKEFYGLD